MRKCSNVLSSCTFSRSCALPTPSLAGVNSGKTPSGEEVVHNARLRCSNYREENNRVHLHYHYHHQNLQILQNLQNLQNLPVDHRTKNHFRFLLHLREYYHSVHEPKSVHFQLLRPHARLRNGFKPSGFWGQFLTL